MQVSKDEVDQIDRQFHDKPRSAPSSPKIGTLSMPNKRHSGVPSKGLSHKLNATIEKNHSLRRCETSVTHHYHANSSSPGFPETISTSEDSSNDEELQMPRLNLDLVEDMKDYLFKATSISHSTPPAVDRSVRTWKIVCFFVVVWLRIIRSFMFYFLAFFFPKFFWLQVKLLNHTQ